MTDDLIIEQIAAKVREERCILFLGAGIHAPPPKGSEFQYPEGERPPIGSQLSKLLAEKCQLLQEHKDENPENLQRVSSFFEIKRTRGQLIKEIRAAVDHGKQPSALVRGLARLNFPLVVTTNYDRLWERALRLAGKEPYIALYSSDPRSSTPIYYDNEKDPTSEEPFVLKIHGDVTAAESIVITDEDYIHFVLRMSQDRHHHPVPEEFLHKLRRWDVLFIGYSLLDYNLRLLFKTLRWTMDRAKIPDSYSVDIRPDPLIQHILSDKEKKYNIQLIVKNAWEFVPKLYQEVRGESMEHA
jgi:hypothetical protein